MNPRQRRGVIILALALIAGLATFTAVFRYVAEVNSRVGPETQALLVLQPVEAWQPIPESALGFADVPTRWLPAAAVLDPEDIIGRVAPAGLTSGSILQEGMVVDPPEIGPDQREFAMTVDPEGGVGGTLEPDSVVDIVAAYGGSERTAQSARVIVAGARVLRVDSAEAGQLVTLALGTQEALDVAYAQSYADRVRLVLVPPGTQSASVGDVATAPDDRGADEVETP